MRPVVIFHGWSDHAVSFVPLQKEVAARLQVSVTNISLAEWLSTDDNVTYDDLVTRMDAVWTAYGLSRTPASVDVIVHSTGSLLVRDWMSRYFPTPGTSPIKHFVMLAPANFGSPLAHKGTSFIGRVIKGWDSPKMFQVGATLLKGLELASSYTWSLAQRDLFVSSPYYGAGLILGTVIVGNAGYTGIAAAANEPGSDGTVRVSTANLNAARLSVDLTDPAQPRMSGPQLTNGLIGFRLMDGLNHGTVHDPTQPGVANAVIDALTIDDSGFNAYCTQLGAVNQQILTARENASDRYYWGYQNTVFLVKDQFGTHVRDYFLEFFGPAADTFWEQLFHGKVIEDVHAYSLDSGYRTLLIDTKRLRDAQAQVPNGILQFSLTASPDISNNEVGYATFGDNDIGALSIPAAQFPLLFQPNRTVLVDVTIRRQQKPDIFQLGIDPPPRAGR